MGKIIQFSILLFVFWIKIYGVEPLRNVQVVVPSAVTLGNHVTLSCLYDLDYNETLYVVKWYLGEDEFYRYVPKEVPPIQTFPIPGLEIDTSRSDAHIVFLRSVRHEQTGNYKCEVSADAPFFDTDMVSSYMTVVEFPENVPLIEPMKHRYEVGEKIKANCSFGPSRPASNITWFINNVQVRDQFINNLPVFEDGNKRAWVKSSLEIDTDVNSFRNGRLKLKCIANVYSNHKISETQIDEEKPRSASVLGNNKDSSGKLTSTSPDKAVPTNVSNSSHSSRLHTQQSYPAQLLMILLLCATIIWSLPASTLSSSALVLPRELTSFNQRSFDLLVSTNLR